MNEIDPLALKYAAEFSIPPALAQIIARRFPVYEEARSFLYPSLQKLYPPNTLPDIELAAAEITESISKNLPILIYCHDDPDGYTAAAIMYKTLCDLRRENKPEIFIYAINREKDGYVLNSAVLDEYVKKGVKTLITVDFGISNPENFLIAQNKGLKMVICDHHETGFIDFPIPAVDPKRKGSKYPFRELAGVGVTFKLCQYILQKSFKLSDQDFYNIKKEFLAITMLGTIADRVPPLNENRIFCYEGLKAINGLKLPWTEYFLKDGSINFARVHSEIIPVFVSAAYLDSNLGVELLVKKDYDITYRTIDELKLIEEERRNLIEKITREAIDLSKVYEGFVVAIFPEDTSKIKLNHLGSIASRLRDHFGRTAIVILMNSGKCFGELRSHHIDLYEMLYSMKNLFIDFGGHKRAAGFSMSEGNLDKFIEEVNRFINRHQKRESLSNLEPEAFIDKSQINLLEPLFPFGDGNRAPILTDGVVLYTIDHKFDIIDLGIWRT
uniref:Single-stranded-DNA-specific exonuclease RecJ n=1 Tax=candidate division WOR-3 bacterium TaxID=2052148 RepID=A0A7C4XAK0_UNCW3